MNLFTGLPNKVFLTEQSEFGPTQRAELPLVPSLAIQGGVLANLGLGGVRLRRLHGSSVVQRTRKLVDLSLGRFLGDTITFLNFPGKLVAAIGWCTGWTPEM